MLQSSSITGDHLGEEGAESMLSAILLKMKNRPPHLMIDLANCSNQPDELPTDQTEAAAAIEVETHAAAVVEATEVEEPVEAVPTEATIEIDDFKRQNSVTLATCIFY